MMMGLPYFPGFMIEPPKLRQAGIDKGRQGQTQSSEPGAALQEMSSANDPREVSEQGVQEMITVEYTVKSSHGESHVHDVFGPVWITIRKGRKKMKLRISDHNLSMGAGDGLVHISTMNGQFVIKPRATNAIQLETTK